MACAVAAFIVPWSTRWRAMKSSYQELMDLVAQMIENAKDAAELRAKRAQLLSLSHSLKRDRDLLDAVLHRLDGAIDEME